MKDTTCKLLLKNNTYNWTDCLAMIHMKYVSYNISFEHENI